MKIIVTGASGQVGWELARALFALGEVIALDRNQCDLSAPHLLSNLLNELKPDIIINAAAYTAVDKAEEEETLATIVNGTSVGILAEWCKKNNALFVHYSTDYVFDGCRQIPYVETDIPSPVNAYGRSKLLGERLVQQVGGDWLIFRTSWVYSARSHNFLRTILRLAQERKELKVVDDQIGAPTWARYIADVTLVTIKQAVVERQLSRFSSQLYHMTSSGSTSWYGFANFIIGNSKAILEEAISAKRIIGVKTSEYPTTAARPAFSCLNSNKLNSYINVCSPPWMQLADLCLQDYFR